MRTSLVKRIVTAGVACLMLAGVAACGSQSSDGVKQHISSEQSTSSSKSSTGVNGTGTQDSSTTSSNMSSPYNWSSWDIKSVKRVDSRFVDITMENNSEESLNSETSYFVTFKALKGSEQLAGMVYPVGFGGTTACKDSSGNDLESIAPGQTAVCRFTFNPNGGSASMADATAVRPYSLMDLTVCSQSDKANTDLCTRRSPNTTYKIEN